MRQILSERNLVVVLFIFTLVIFFFAKEGTRQIEKGPVESGSVVSSPLPVNTLPAISEAKVNVKF